MLASGFPYPIREAIKHPPDRGSPWIRSEEWSVRRSKRRTMSPPRAVSAPSGDLCDARLTRAPQEISESPGSPFFGYFLWRSKESDLPSGNPRLGGDTKHVGAYQFAAQSDRAMQFHGFMVRQAHHERIEAHLAERLRRQLHAL